MDKWEVSLGFVGIYKYSTKDKESINSKYINLHGKVHNAERITSIEIEATDRSDAIKKGLHQLWQDKFEKEHAGRQLWVDANKL